MESAMRDQEARDQVRAVRSEVEDLRNRLAMLMTHSGVKVETVPNNSMWGYGPAIRAVCPECKR
jgi:hypothetical protein